MSAGRILAIDGEPQIQRLKRRTLTYAGYEIGDAKSGDEGFVNVREFRPDLVLPPYPQIVHDFLGDTGVWTD